MIKMAARHNLNTIWVMMAIKSKSCTYNFDTKWSSLKENLWMKKGAFFKKKKIKIVFAYFVELQQDIAKLFRIQNSLGNLRMRWIWKEDAREEKKNTILERMKESWKVCELLQKGHVALACSFMNNVGCSWMFGYCEWDVTESRI